MYNTKWNFSKLPTRNPVLNHFCSMVLFPFSIQFPITFLTDNPVPEWNVKRHQTSIDIHTFGFQLKWCGPTSASLERMFDLQLEIHSVSQCVTVCLSLLLLLFLKKCDLPHTLMFLILWLFPSLSGCNYWKLLIPFVYLLRGKREDLIVFLLFPTNISEWCLSGLSVLSVGDVSRTSEKTDHAL